MDLSYARLSPFKVGPASMLQQRVQTLFLTRVLAWTSLGLFLSAIAAWLFSALGGDHTLTGISFSLLLFLFSAAMLLRDINSIIKTKIYIGFIGLFVSAGCAACLLLGAATDTQKSFFLLLLAFIFLSISVFNYFSRKNLTNISFFISMTTLEFTLFTLAPAVLKGSTLFPIYILIMQLAIALLTTLTLNCLRALATERPETTGSLGASLLLLSILSLSVLRRTIFKASFQKNS